MINFNPQISPYNKIGVSTQKCSTPSFGKSLDKDTFIKSKNNTAISFGSSMSLKRKFERFQKDIESYVFKSSKIELSEIEKIVQKYSPRTMVKSYDELPQNSNALSTTVAYVQNPINFTPDNKAIAQDKIIFIRPIKNQDKESKLSFLDKIEHEFTHVLQEESPDRTPKIDFFNDFLKNNNIQNPKTLNTIIMCPKVFASVEHYISLPLRKALQKSDDMPEKLPFYSKDLINQIYVSQTGINAKDYAKAIIFTILNKSEKQSGGFDKQQVIKYIALVANKEKEAYENSTLMLKRHLGIEGHTDLDLRIQLYEIFEQTAKEMLKN